MNLKVQKAGISRMVPQIPTSSAGSLFVSTSHKNSQIQQFIVHLNLQRTYNMLYLSFMSRSLLMGLLCTIFIGAFSSPLPLTPNNTTSLVGRLEERYQVARGYSGQFSSLTMRLYRTHKDGKAITPGTKMTKDEDWILFIGPDGFRAHAGPGGTLVAETMKSDKTRLGHSVSSSKLTLDLGEKAGFHTAAARDKAFQQLLTEIPALHAGNGVPKTNLAYLNGIFAYLASVEAVSNREPPETWVRMYNEMHALGGTAD
ncbi:hypothetical protein FB446DRAFT_843648 [Lentinula raphanica]|nr:hypothetical protein FB446DRAFT_843648 [Lentinula raphanica]